MNHKSEHTFHIPVMGLAFTIDSPIKVARFGISSVISLMEDRLIEMMRRHYYPSINQVYQPISHREPDYRAKRITDYLNLVNTIVQQQMQKLKSEAMEHGSEIVKYFEMLPQDSMLRKLYEEMRHTTDEKEKKAKQDYLRTQLVPGSIDVNVMTKADRDAFDKEGRVIPDGSDVVSALRGYINSELTNSSIIFSAGMNPRVFSYLEQIDTFDPDINFEFRKKVVIKVSDFRSALIQGKFLAKKGIWVSEFRIESGLNCGGHAFATEGHLLGPILEEFKTKKQELEETIFEIFKPAINKKNGLNFTHHPGIQISVQGGIGTHEEDRLFRQYYNVSSTGWGTPFLLVPEATTVDTHTLNLLSAAEEKDISLSNYSPLGVRFYFLHGTTAELEKQKRIANGKPGSPCTEKHLSFNTEFTKEPICTASHRYQELKLAHLKSLQLPDQEFEAQKADVLGKECLCVGLSNAAALSYDEPFLKNLKAVNICPGPNIVNFSKIVSLKAMTDHIYGRTNLVTNKQRPHVFLAEMKLYINYLKEQLVKENGVTSDTKRRNYYQSFIQNLSEAINYYQNMLQNFLDDQESFKQALQYAKGELSEIRMRYALDNALTT
ncbi:MAG: hypothetical protein HUU34_18635 [Saprospiraceae bacterium]|nr:hypothetical protein [Saprospiraceae bacterium]